MIQPPLWLDGWEAEADGKAGLPPDGPDHTADRLAGYARPCTRTRVPSRRPIHDVIRSL